MEKSPLKINPNAVKINNGIEKTVNFIYRSKDSLLAKMHLGGRKANYDDLSYSFIGGDKLNLRKKHYDKSLKLLWKAKPQIPDLGINDQGKNQETLLYNQAIESMDGSEKNEFAKIRQGQFKKVLNTQYSPAQKKALLKILTAIGHGEAYAWIVSTELLREIKSTGARAALTMQVLEEAKHFVVLKEMLKAFDLEIPRQSIWEYILLENVLKAKGLEKFFGMNVLVEGIALSIFGLLSCLPGMEILKLFHLDESRHCGLPANYFKEFPMSFNQKHNPIKRLKRLKLLLPTLTLIPYLEAELAVLGVDAFDFGGSVVRKVTLLAEKSSFFLPVPRKHLLNTINSLFNQYCQMTRPDHCFQNFLRAETTEGEKERKIEREIFIF